MFCKSRSLAAAVTICVLVAVGCSSASSSVGSNSTRTSVGGSSAGSGSGPGRPPVGVITDLGGLASPKATIFPLGIKAGEAVAAQQGANTTYVVADASSSPTGALVAAQKLVNHEQVPVPTEWCWP